VVLPSNQVTATNKTSNQIQVNKWRYTVEKCIYGLQFRRRHYRPIFIRLAVVASQSREIRRNSVKIWP